MLDLQDFGSVFSLPLGRRDGHMPSTAGLPSSHRFCKIPKDGKSPTAALCKPSFGAAATSFLTRA